MYQINHMGLCSFDDRVIGMITGDIFYLSFRDIEAKHLWGPVLK